MMMHFDNLSDRAVENLLNILVLTEIKTLGGRISEEDQDKAVVVLRALRLYQRAILEECRLSASWSDGEAFQQV